MAVPLEVVDEEHDDQDLLGHVGLSPELVQEQGRHDEGGRLLEEPSQLRVQRKNWKKIQWKSETRPT